jgi:hypothetical protein
VTVATPDATRWTCGRCGVSVGRIDGESVTMPETWSQSDEGVYCLGCSRAHAEDEATEAAPAGSSHSDLARIRRTARIEFEIRRSPEAPDRTIARACQTSTAMVGAVRDASD